MSDRPQDLHEELANSALHGAALVGACLAVPQLLQSAPAAHPAAIWGVLVFGATMALLYGTSTLYHALPPGRAKQWVLRLDHAAIHLFIAGSFSLTLPLFCGVHNPRFTRPFCAVPRTSVFRTASG